MKTYFGFSDEVIAQIAKLVQLGMLTGTNVVDHLRLVRLAQSEGDGGNVVLTEEYKEYFESSLKHLLEEAEDIKDTMRSTEAKA